MIDVFRLPAYLAGEWSAFTHTTVLVVTAVGVIVGTLAGARVLDHIPERVFKRVLGGVLVAMGVLLVLKR